MLTRRDVLHQLKIRGIKGLSTLKKECRDLEYHMDLYYDLKISKKGRANHPPAAERKTPSPESSGK